MSDYIASLIGIDPTYYEAARLDGATKWQEITKITLPCLVPTIITLLLLSIGRIFYSDFFWIILSGSDELRCVVPNNKRN